MRKPELDLEEIPGFNRMTDGEWEMLSAEEKDAYLAGVHLWSERCRSKKERKQSGGVMSYHVGGYGEFALSDFEIGDEFARFDGTVCRVLDKPPHRPDYIFVLNDCCSIIGTRIWLHKNAKVHAITISQARRMLAQKNAHASV